MTNKDNIVITGTGIITSLGIGKAETLKKLKAGQRVIVPSDISKPSIATCLRARCNTVTSS